MRAHSMRKSNQILHNVQTILEKISGSITSRALAKKFCDTNADAWSVCGS